MNRLMLAAALVQRSALRYTPAGLPALDLGLHHASRVLEDGHPRKVQMDLRAVALGEVTQRLLPLPLGSHLACDGFLSSGRNGRGLLFHITAVESLPDPSQG